MLVTCKRCGAAYARLFLQGSAPLCRCGAPLDLGDPGPAGIDHEALLVEEAKLRELGRLADRISSLIVASDCPRVDVDIQRAALRRRCQDLFPDKMHLFDMIYESRFRRLWEQFGADRARPGPWPS